MACLSHQPARFFHPCLIPSLDYGPKGEDAVGCPQAGRLLTLGLGGHRVPAHGLDGGTRAATLALH